MWKKVAGGVMSAALLTSLFATTALAAPVASKVLTCAVALDTSTCTQVADGASIVKFTGIALATAPTAGSSLVVTTSGPAFSANGGNFVLSSDKMTATITFSAAVTNVALSDTLTLTAPTIAGSTTVKATLNSIPDPVTGLVTKTDEGTITVTWSSSASLLVSESNSRVKIVGPASACLMTNGEFSEDAVSAAPAKPTATPVATLCILVENGAGTTVPDGTKIAVTISPFGLVGTGQVANLTTTAGKASVQIVSTGLSGKSTISIVVTDSAGNVTTFAPKTFTFSGDLAKFVLANQRYAFAKGAGIAANTIVGVITATDASGNAVACNTAWVAKETVSTALLGTLSVNKTLDADGDGTADCTVVSAAVPAPGPATLGSTTIVVQDTATSPSVVSAPITVYVSDTPATMAVTFDKTSVATGAIATASVAVKDSAGRPAADGTQVNAFVNAGLVIGTDGTTPSLAKTKNGIAKYTFIAANTAGIATVTAIDTADGITANGSITVTPSGQLPGAVTFAPTGSALGNTTVGPFTAATKIQSVGGYITWKVDGGAALAGQTIQIWVYKKYTATGAWAGPTMLTTRKANASGVAYVNIHTGGVLWLSLRPVLPATTSTAAVWGPTSIGRWR